MSFAPYIGNVLQSYKINRLSKRINEHESQINFISKLNAANKLSHEFKPHDQLLIFEEEEPALAFEVGHRAIGVVYDPAYEMHGNYVPTIVPERYDAFVYVDESKALEPLVSEFEFM